MRVFLAIGFVLLACLPAAGQEPGRPPSMPDATRVEAVTVHSEAGLLAGRDFLFRTRVRVDLDGFVKPELDLKTDGGRRMVIDLPGIVNKSGRSIITQEDTCVKRVRIGEQSKPKKVRVVLELQDNVGYDVIDVSFASMPTVGLRPYGRLIITLTQKSL